MTTSTALPSNPKPGVTGALRRISATEAVLFAALSLAYWIAAIRISAQRPFWMDELMAIWTARMPDIAAMWDVIKRGGEFSPPFYDLSLHYIIALVGDGFLTLRLPSITAVFIVSLAAFVLMRRRYATLTALTAMALCLTGGLFPFALEVRPYAPLTACFALAVLAWDIPASARPTLARSAAIFALLTIAIGMHFYAVLLAAAVGLMEFIWMIRHRRIRWLYVIAIGLACLSVFLWLPIMQHIMAYNSGDTAAPEYYARPRAILLPFVYLFLMIGFEASMIIAPATVMLVAIAGWMAVKVWRRGNPVQALDNIGNLDIIIGITCAIPLLVFIFSATVTHTYNLRYVIAGAFGLSMLTARLIASIGEARAFSYFVVAASIGLTAYVAATDVVPTSRERALTVVNQAPAGMTVVTGDALRFMELREAARADVSARLLYLKSLAGTASPDPTNENQLLRWAAIKPAELPFSEIEPFLAAKPRETFLLFTDGEAVDLLPKQLAARGYISKIILRDGNATLAEVRAAAR